MTLLVACDGMLSRPESGLGFDDDCDFRSEVARNADGHLVIAEVPNRLPELNVSPIDGRAKLLTERGSDVVRGDGAVEPILTTDLCPQRHRYLADASGEGLILGRELPLTSQIDLVLDFGLPKRRCRCHGRETTRDEVVTSIAIGHRPNVAGVAEVLYGLRQKYLHGAETIAWGL